MKIILLLSQVDKGTNNKLLPRRSAPHVTLLIISINDINYSVKTNGGKSTSELVDVEKPRFFFFLFLVRIFDVLKKKKHRKKN